LDLASGFRVGSNAYKPGTPEFAIFCMDARKCLDLRRKNVDRSKIRKK
jgi:hypothetical protein